MDVVVVAVSAENANELDACRSLMREYAQQLVDESGVDLCFQDFDAELAALPGEYTQPRGALLLATLRGQPVGCVALRPLDASDYANAGEMKRLFVRKAARGSGLGRLLTEAVLNKARESGYDSVLLDTLDDMEAARALYEDLGFEEIPPYYHSPIAGAHYLRVRL